MRPVFPFIRFGAAALLLLMLRLPGADAQTREPRFHRFQYHKYSWQAFHTSAFHIYFPAGTDSLCAAVAGWVTDAAKVVQQRMGGGLQQVPNIIIYPSPDGLYESNIGSFEPREVTLPTFILKGSRLVLAYNGSYRDLKAQLYEALARAAWEAQLAGGVEAQAQGAVKDAVPYWISEGAIRYFAHGWPLQAEDRMLHALKEESYPVWEALAARYPALSGQAFCYFLSQKYFRKTPQQLIIQLRKRKPLPRALRLITQTPADSLYMACLQFYKERAAIVFPDADTGLPAPQPVPVALVHKAGIINKVVTHASGKAAFVVAAGHQRYVYVYDPLTHAKTRITTYAMPPWIIDHSRDIYPLVSWAAGGQDLLITAPVKGKLTIRRYSTDGHRRDEYPLPGIDGISSAELYTGNDYLLAAWRQGRSDIVSYNLPKDRYTALTSDPGDDYEPLLIPGSSELFFTSERLVARSRKAERLSDTVIATQGIFRKKDAGVLPWLTDTMDYLRYEKPVLLQDGRMLVATNIKGTAQPVLIANKEQPASYTFLKPATGSFQYLPENGAFATYHATRDSLFLYQQPLQGWLDGQADTSAAISPWLADYRAAAAERAKEDSILKAAKTDEQPSFLSGVLSGGRSGRRAAKSADSLQEALRYSNSKVTPYVLQLYSAYFTAKVNNDYFINRYQPYESYQGMFKFPEIGGMAQGGFSDLFENHHFTVAFRLPAGSEGSDFFVRYNNTARKADWGLAYYRKAEDLKPDPLRRWVDATGRPYPNTAKVKSNYFEVNAQYPLSYYSGIGFSTAIRHDKTIFLATEKYSLEFPAFKSLWSITTLSYSINKLRPTLPLLYRGFTGDVKVDLFKGFTQSEDALAGSSINLSYHQPLYKYITLVAQLHAGTSSGDSKVLYNLGGVDNNVTPRTDTSVHFPQDAPYAFQTLVTPFRGYYQNTLYGSSYCLLNADIYFPLFQSLIPLETPLSSINNLQLGAFADVAAAGGDHSYTTAAKGLLAAYGFSARTTLAGYPLRFDIAWPGTFREKPVWYLSLNLR